MARNLLEIRNARIMFRNFSGLEKKAMVNGTMRTVNEEGDRNFNIVLNAEESTVKWNGEPVTSTEELIDILQRNYFQISVRPAKEEGDLPQYRMKVSLNYEGSIRPRLYMISAGNPTLLDEETVTDLDISDICKADVVINSGKMFINNKGEEAVKAWCNEGYFTVLRSDLASEYGV